MNPWDLSMRLPSDLVALLACGLCVRATPKAGGWPLQPCPSASRANASFETPKSETRNGGQTEA